ncbi:MAG: hypothetical protein ABI618_03170 [Nitrospirota bacterium]
MPRKSWVFIFILSVVFIFLSVQITRASEEAQDWYNECVDKDLLVNGDFQSGENLFGMPWFPGQWSVGPSLNTQLIKYDFAKKKAGFNTSIGIGASFRFYPTILLKNIDPNKNEPPATKADDSVNISEIKAGCRQTSYGSGQGQNPKTKKNWDYYAAPLFSITPTLYATKPVADDDLSLQPAILLGFFEDILNMGVGFNLTGPSGEKGNVFILMGIGYGFKF